MKIVVMGSGGIGGYFGARLAAAGQAVTFVARGTHLAAMQSHGLRIESPLGNLHLQPSQAVASPQEAGPADAIIFAVKMGDTERAAASLAPIMRPGVPVFTFQNGVEAPDMIAAALGPGHAVPGVARISSHIDAPGVIAHKTPFARLEFAEADNTSSDRCRAFHAACTAAGIDAEIPADIQRALWVKFAMLAPMSGVTTLTQRTAGPLRRNPDTRSLIEAAIREVVAVGKATGVALGDSDVDAVLQTIDALPEGMTTSMSHDRTSGKPLELNWLSGGVVRIGQRRGVPTPTHRFLAQALALESNGRAAGA
ncbi:MAG TPA: 2-dehydropantoate 2-reductase [Devosia sp.]|nr:2-dehydropantoate 2-reductase [Devosia sp.]